jgi:hypothetical protein
MEAEAKRTRFDDKKDSENSVSAEAEVMVDKRNDEITEESESESESEEEEDMIEVEEEEEEEEIKETKWEYARRTSRESIGKALAKKWGVPQVSENEITLYVKFKLAESQSIFYKESDDEDREMLLDCCEELGLERDKHDINTILSFAKPPRNDGKCVAM